MLSPSERDNVSEEAKSAEGAVAVVDSNNNNNNNDDEPTDERLYADVEQELPTDERSGCYSDHDLNGNITQQQQQQQTVETNGNNGQHSSSVTTAGQQKKVMKVAADAPWKDRMWEGAFQSKFLFPNEHYYD